MTKLTAFLLWALAVAIPASSFAQDRGTIAVIGTGDMGDSLGPRLAEIGYTIVYGSRDPSREKVRNLVDLTGHGASATTQKAAANRADIVLLAVPWPPMEQVAQNLGDLSGKIVIDISDPTQQAPDGYLEIMVETSSAEMIQRWNPGAQVVKTPFAGSFVIDEPTMFGEPVATYIAADDRAAKEVVANIVYELGLFPLDAGPLRIARQIEGLSLLYLAPLLQRRSEVWELVPRRSTYLPCISDDDWFAPVADADDLADFPNLDKGNVDCDFLR